MKFRNLFLPILIPGIRPGFKQIIIYINSILVMALVSTCGGMSSNPTPVSSVVAQVTDAEQPGFVNGQPTSGTPVDEQGVKISVLENGLYRLTRAELEEMGAESVLESPEAWRLLENGAEINFWVDGSGRNQRLLFFGRAGNSLYSRVRLYLLLPVKLSQHLEGDALDLQPRDRLDPEHARVESYQVGAALPEDMGMASVMLEENERYFPQADGVERWFWQSLAAPNTTVVDLDLPDLAVEMPADAKAQVRVALWASTASPPIDPDHHMQLLINGELVLNESWDGQGRRWLSVEFPASLLNRGETGSS